MRKLSPLSDISVPSPKPDKLYTVSLENQTFSFPGLKHLLAQSDFKKAGDTNSGLAAPNEITREAARAILSDLTLQHIYDHPLLDPTGNTDAVMRINYDIDIAMFQAIAPLTLGAFKDLLLTGSDSYLNTIGNALTGVMAAAVTKLLDTHELIYLAKKITRVTKARTTLGTPGTLSSRLQPNHPTDDHRGITLLTYLGLSMGCGDALIGLNPAIDTVENVSSVLHLLDGIRQKTGAPTQICVLAHIKTQLACLAQGAPVEIMFQSLAGTDRTNTEEFDVTISLLDEAYTTMQQKGPLAHVAKQWMYFETGQGSELSYGKHNGIDMTTTEALTYGLARRYDPFMVNNVTGFIGPETHKDNMEMIYSNLQDHFMGKLLGLPMGMAPCFTLHSDITLEGQQMATQMLTAAGANYYMDVYLNTDRMLAYFDTSGHDNQTLREIYHRSATPEFLTWATRQRIFQTLSGTAHRGPLWGDPTQFVQDPILMKELQSATPFIFSFAHCGPRPVNTSTRALRYSHAAARQAVFSELSIDENRLEIPFRHLATQASSKSEHLSHPELGAKLRKDCASSLTSTTYDIQIVISDGLSAEALHHNIYDLLPVIWDGLHHYPLTVGETIVAPYGRVKLAEDIARLLHCKLVVMLIGERPGGDIHSAHSLSAYLVYHLLDHHDQQQAARFSHNPDIQFEYSVISNIYPESLPPAEAASVIVDKVLRILKYHAAGNRLESMQRQPSQDLSHNLKATP